MKNISPNPLNDVVNIKLDFGELPEQPNWGFYKPSDSSISIMKRITFKTPDHKVIINRFDGFERIYFNNPMDVVRDFFRIVPDQFLADYFIFRIFYNHIEQIDIPTPDFVEARNKFISELEKNRDVSIYSVIISILNSMMYGPRKALADYLVKHINRALYLSVRMVSSPQTNVQFTQIEDLEEILGTTFSSRLLEVPDAKNIISRIVNTSILNALSCYSDVMFTNPNNRDIDIIRSSPVFPFNIKDVYPSKEVIPQSGSEEASIFFDRMERKELSKRTYVRSIRSVVVTNSVVQSVLSMIGNKPVVIENQIPSFMNEFILHHAKDFSTKSPCRKYDILDDTDTSEDYRCYIENPDKYELSELSKIVDMDEPGLPVDQTIFTIQFKTNPQDCLEAFDVLSTMDRPRTSPFTLLVRKKIDDLKVTN